MRHWLLICVVLFAQPGWADDEAKVPMIVVASPKETVAGKLVKLDASKSTVDSMEWRLIDGPQEDFVAEGMRASFATPTPGVYFVAIAGATTVTGKSVATIAIVKVTLIPDPAKPGPPPTNPPPGTPPPAPPPTNPPPDASLSNWVRATVRATVTDDSTRGRTAKALAASYRAWASAGGAGARDAQQFVLGSNKLLDLLLTQAGKQAAWKNFRDALDEELASLRLTTIEQHVAAWKEIAAGLEGVQ